MTAHSRRQRDGKRQNAVSCPSGVPYAIGYGVKRRSDRANGGTRTRTQDEGVSANRNSHDISHGQQEKENKSRGRNHFASAKNDTNKDKMKRKLGWKTNEQNLQ